MISEGFQNVALDSIGGGAAIELFNQELDKVLLNIMDVNTKACKAREITIKVVILPTDESREKADVSIEAKSKLVNPKAFSTEIYMGMQGNEFKAVEDSAVEQRLPFNQAKSNIEQIVAQGGK
jgi:hypothetical protein